jgi:cyclopropane fatty-acyl-phospholipid synthase-like methyltransferase
MKLVMTLLVRDEIDVVEAMLNAHYALGVNFVIATDNRSVDGTTKVLERFERQGRLRLIHEPADDYQQDRWVTRMARLAAVEHRAEWVINADADEWWWPRTGDLQTALADVPPHISVVTARRFNFVIRPEDGRPFHERMQWRRTDSLTHDGVRMAVKVCHRAHPAVSVAVGNHEVTGLHGGILDDGRIEVLHFPLRTLGQYERKIRTGAAALARNTHFLPTIGHHWRRAAAVQSDGRLAEEWVSSVYDDDRLRAALAAGEVIKDARVADLVAAGLDCQRPDGRKWSVRPIRPVKRIGAGVPYADGAESEVLAALRRCDDVSWSSDELQEHIVDWPTLVHFSYQRTHLLKPLRIGPGMRVLDVGAGTGALTRHVAEQGATVVALEGNMTRAEAAAERCRDLDGVDVFCGSLDDLDLSERFDLVLLVGVLEYAGAALGGSDGAQAMLRRARSHLRENGVVAVAIENQLGLKYLLGGREDHLAKPWVGIDGYPGPPGVRTWSRRVLRAMLAEAGLVEQHWLAPFPDYKLPTVVLDERLYERADAAELIEQLVPHPVAFHDQAPLRLADAAAAHRVWAEAGMAPEVASSFLIVAGSAGAALADIVPQDTLAWMFGSFRRPPWRRERLLTDAMRLVTVGDTRPHRREWIGQGPGEERSFVRGRTLALDALDAVRAHDLDSLGAVLRRWRDELAARSVEIGEVAPGVHPFLLPDATRGLPDGLFDASLANFVQTDEGLALIDDEWRTCGTVDCRVAEYRALWSLAVDIVSRGIVHPWGETASINDIVGRLQALTGSTIEPRVVTAWRKAELELQRLIAGTRAVEMTARWIDGTRTSADVRPRQQADVELERLRDELPRLRADVVRLEGERAHLSAERAEYLSQRDHFEGVIAAQQAEINRLRGVRGFVGQLVRRHRLLRAIAARVGFRQSHTR